MARGIFGYVRRGRGKRMFYNRTLKRLDRMLDDAINGKFEESDFTETSNLDSWLCLQSKIED